MGSDRGTGKGGGGERPGWGAMEAKGAGWVPPVNAGLGVCDLVEAGHPEPVGAPTLPLVHEVTDSQDDL